MAGSKRMMPSRNMSIRLAVYLFIMNGFILVVSSTAGYAFTSSVIKKNTAYYAEHYIGSMNNELNFYFRDVDLMTNSLFYLSKNLFDGLELDDRKLQLQNDLSGLRGGRDYIEDILVLSNDLQAAGTAPIDMGQLQRADIYRKIMGSEGELVVSPIGYPTFVFDPSKANRPVLFAGRKIVSGHTSRMEGIIIVTIKAERITDIVQKREKHYDEQLFLVDRQGILMEPARIGEMPHDGEEMLKEAGGERASFIRYGHMIVSGNDRRIQPMNIVGIIPEKALLKDAAAILNLQLALNFGLLLIGMTLALVIAYRFLRPIVRLAHFMRTVGNQQLITYRQRERGNNDEIGYLIISFNRMIRRLRRSFRHIHDEREKQKKAELRALQAQINPHFIYNTLNNVRWLARMGQTDSIFDILTSMNIVLVSAFQLEKPIITIGEELQHLAAYITIQTMIHPGKFDVVYEMDDSIRSAPIARMSLQPLVENAIFHGVLPKSGHGLITIKGWYERDRIMLQVADSGVGAADETGLQRDPGAERREHVGMRNVDKRIKLYFGSQFGVDWKSERHVGTTVTVALPNKQI
ncbi:cache domain-containing sensor histidine kinase [Paenibacillus spongiae]|uniref:Histidine kinase n=1 Tax=Paenibacillus spongiae TaxID=2909671 RepID=A0ABY5SL70_9BACL|nr:sensor histidine kinase [Paenibacillus spongiae]UVI32998.1 histidine kinase [Paenibacillus spongiae]